MIPVNVPKLSSRSKELLAECIDTGWISSEGSFVAQFEEMFAEYIGVKHGIACCNATVALELAVAALKIGAGDEVIMPAHTIIACAQAVIRRGGTPVLVDMDPGTWQMDVGQVEGKINNKTRAIMPVHIFGHPTDMEPLMALAHKYGLHIIEDAAEAHGAEYKGSKCGSMGNIAAFSFYANKIVTTGEGGMVVTNDDVLAERLRYLRNLCFEPQQRFLHNEMGYNFRFTNLQAAVGVAQMEDIEGLVSQKVWMGREYTQRLAGVPGIRIQAVREWAKHVYWVYGLLLDDEVPFDAFEWAGMLRTKGVDTRPFFWPMHQQPVFREMGLFQGESYPVSERLARRGLYIPSGMALTIGQIEEVVDTVRESLKW
jgi:perosamine synthetase